MNKHLRFTSFVDMLKKQAENHSKRICLYYPDKADPSKYATLTYEQLNNVTNHLAEKFAVLVDKKSNNEVPVVCLLANSSPDYLLTVFALLKLDVIVYPLSIRNSEAAIMYLLEKSNVSYLFYSDEYSAMRDATTAKFGSVITMHRMESIPIADLVQAGHSNFDSKMEIDQLDRIRFIFHSSGTTSFPKPISLAVQCMFGHYESYAPEMSNQFWSQDDVLLSVMPLFHAGGMAMTFVQWYVGGCVAMPLARVFPPTPNELSANLAHPVLNKLVTVPFVLEQLLPLLRENNNHGFQLLSRFRFVMTTGAICSPNVGQELVDNDVNFVVHFGATETGSILVSEYDSPKKDNWRKLRPLKVREPYLRMLPIESGLEVRELGIVSTDPFLARNLTFDNGLYFLSDLFIEEPPGSNSYIVRGRKDEVLVHVTGEKSNPLPMELVIRHHRIVAHAVVVGHRRSYCSVLIQLNLEEAFKHELREIERLVFDAVADANQQAPNHSHIVPELIKILPMGQRLPVTNKGNILRKQVERDYGTLIEKMYDEFINGHQSTNVSTHLRSKETICSYLEKTISEILHKPAELLHDHSKSLYSLSLDSLTAVQLRNALCRDFGQVEQNILFEFSTIDSLADELTRIAQGKAGQTSDDPQHYKETEQIIDKYIALIKTDSNLTRTCKEDQFMNRNADDQRVFLITGANGSLGSHLLFQLLKRSDVRRIYCLVRGQDPIGRLRHALQQRQQDSAVLLDTTHVVVLPMDLSDDHLGQTPTVYEQIQTEVTDIIHSAWRMDFNMTIRDFDQESLRGLNHLLRFAARPLASMAIRCHFISSVSAAGSGLINPVQEEPLPRQIGLALAQGYGQSKYAAEHICWTAMDYWGIPVDIYRLAQISGDSETGVWNTAEMISLMICAGGGQMGVLPEDGQSIDWLPVNFAAASIIDIAMTANERGISHSDRVHHLVNPNVISWPQLLEYLRANGLEFQAVSIKDWLAQLLANPNNPAYTLADFFAKIFQHGKKFELAHYTTEKTVKRTTTLEHCSAVSKELVRRYLNYWRQIGFLKQE